MPLIRNSRNRLVDKRCTRLNLNLAPPPSRKRKRARKHQCADQRQSHRHFVRDHLRTRTQSAEQRVLRIRRPAREDQRQHADARHREHQQQSDVNVGNDGPVGPNGITEKTMNAEATAMYGAKKKIQRSAFSGMKSSLVKSLRPSAIGCSSPHGPTASDLAAPE